MLAAGTSSGGEQSIQPELDEAAARQIEASYVIRDAACGGPRPGRGSGSSNRAPVRDDRVRAEDLRRRRHIPFICGFPRRPSHARRDRGRRVGSRDAGERGCDPM